MRIEKALEHLKWKFENTWQPTEKDIEAYKSIVDYKQKVDDVYMEKNSALAKLWVHQMILLSTSKMYSAERCIQIMDEILNKSVYEWCMILKEEIPMMRFRSVGNHKYPLKIEDELNLTARRERNKKIVDEFEDDLTKALKYEISEEDIIKFVSKNITRIVLLYDK